MIDFNSITRVSLGIGVMGRRSEAEPSGCSPEPPRPRETLLLIAGRRSDKGSEEVKAY